MRVLIQGSKGPDVRQWQYFLVGQGYKLFADGKFGPNTFKATRQFQRSHELFPDAIVASRTLGYAMALGFDAGIEDKGHILTPSPFKPAFRPANATMRRNMFGAFKYTRLQNKKGKYTGRIRVEDNWVKNNIVRIKVPQLVGMRMWKNKGGSMKRSSGSIRVHRKTADQFMERYAAWDKAGLMPLVLNWVGSYVARCARGRDRLSNHAYGTADDINSLWNPLGSIPAAYGKKGSVVGLIEIGEEYGFYWGGYFKGRKDGMHFEVAKLL